MHKSYKTLISRQFLGDFIMGEEKGWSNISDFIKSLIPSIKAQIAEKVQIGDKDATNITVNIENITIQSAIPQQANPKKIAEAEITDDLKERIKEDVMRDLRKKYPGLPSFKKTEQYQLITDSTSSSTATIISVGDTRRHPPSKSDYDGGADETSSTATTIPRFRPTQPPFSDDEDETI